jgi:hypothetical protein
MVVNDDKTTSGDNIKVPKFDHSNKTVSRDSRIRAYTQSFKFAAMTKYGTAGGALFQPLAITKAGATPPSLHFAKKDFNHVAFAPFATACFRSICTSYLEQDLFSSDRQTQVIRHGSYVFRLACE